ncbi:MAG: LacI family transcriptional regulator [Anaerolineae bacterium]|nr:LacI family transcriptional regulator [Anaerolineae bacterium]
MPTLEDVAKKAGVSTATVSKVLSNTPYFTDSTRQKVMKAVDELGYVPHLAARALAAAKTGIIAVVFPRVYDGVFGDPHTLNILEGIEAECTRHDYNVLLSTPRLADNSLDEHYLRLIQSGYLDGVIALDNVPFFSVLEPVFNKGIPVVSLGAHPSKYYVRSDDHAGGYQLMKHLLELNHKIIGIIGVPDDLNFSAKYRMNGIREAVADAGLNFEQFPIFEGDFSNASGAQGAEQLVQQHPDLTALLCINDRMAMGAIQQLHRMGRRVPDDVAVVGYDNIPMAAVFDPPLTTIDIHAPLRGRDAAHMLFDVISGKFPSPVIYPVDLIVRESSRR